MACLTKENDALVTDPYHAPLASPALPQSSTARNSLMTPSSRCWQLPTLPMMELEFWAALVADCPLTAQRLSPLITNKIRSSLAWSGVAKHRGGLGYNTS